MGRAKRWETLVRVERETTGGERMSEMNEREERRGVERIDWTMWSKGAKEFEKKRVRVK